MNEGADTTYVWNLNGAEVLALEDHRFSGRHRARQ